MSPGCVYLVGAGPGDPGLLTLRGREVLASADVVIYDHLVPTRLLDYAPASAELIYAGKQAGRHTLSQDQINRLLVEHARKGRSVVRLKGGDPFVFGRGGEEASALAEAGVSFQVVPGVTAAVAAAACAGIPLTHRGLAGAVGFLTGHETPAKAGSDINYEALAAFGGTLAFYMPVGNLEAICAKLQAGGLDGATPAAAIRWGATPAQRVLTGTVATLGAKARSAGLEAPAILLIGMVVALRERLKWFERRPLFARRVVVTRAKAQAGEMADKLRRLGAETIEIPAIRITKPADPAPLDQAVRELAGFDWVVFTSVNGVEGFFAALHRAGLDSRALAASKLAAIGPATAAALEQFGLKADLQPETYTSDETAKALQAADDLHGKSILLPRANIAPPDLAEALSRCGAAVRSVVAYRTVPEDVDAQAVTKLLEGGVHWITFTSASTVRNFFAAVPADTVRSDEVRLASIGPATSAALGEVGLTPAVEPETHTVDGLIDAMVEKERPRGDSR